MKKIKKLFTFLFVTFAWLTISVQAITTNSTSGTVDPNSKFITKAKEELNRFKKEEEERRARIERQERAISSCSTADEVVSLYNREKSNSINIDKCSLRAFELAKCEEDYRKILSIFGVRTSGGKKAKTSLDEIEKKRKEAKERRVKKDGETSHCSGKTLEHITRRPRQAVCKTHKMKEL